MSQVTSPTVQRNVSGLRERRPGDPMTYAEFRRRFGGACRSKHLRRTSAGSRLPFRSWLLPETRRPYRLPQSSELPAEFIRLCPWEAEYLFTIAGCARKAIVETGRFNGGSAFVMACANRKVPIFSVDIAPQDDERLKRCLDRAGIGENVRLIVGDSQQTKYPEVGEIDVLYIDGDHSYEGCKSDLENWYPQLVRNGHLLLHDSYAGNEVQEAVVDFIAEHDVHIIRSPWIPAQHWHQPTGSITHFIKRD